MKHTPGEWKAEELLDRWAIKAGKYVIASVYKDANNPGEAEANAKLMAAQTDLLEACQTVIKQRERQTAWLTLEDAEKIKVAIAKATESSQ